VATMGQWFNFTVVYHGTPSSSDGFLGFSFSSRNGLPLITTLSEPMGARSWWPCNDIPRDKVDSVDIIVTVDTSLVVSSNGLVQSDTANGDGTHTVHWKSRYPIAPYLVSLGIHPYAVWFDYYNYGPTDSMPIEFFVYPDHDQYSRPYFDSVVARMIQVLATKYGQYPFIDEKYGCTHFNWGGAMEHQTNTSTTSSSFGYSQPVVVHELSHQWWGDMVTCSDWHHIWINEGFATYSEALYFEEIYGPAYYHDYMNDFEYTAGGSVYIQDTTSIWSIFGAIPYDKGAWVLHMLRHIIGDSLFFQSLANYRAQYHWSHASTEDFQGVVEATTGRDLDWFFQEWIYGEYRPYYRYSYLSEADPNGGWNTYLHIRQTQVTDPQVFTMPIDIVLTTAGGDETQAVFNDRQDQDFILHTDQEPTSLTPDPDRWISRSTGWEGYAFHIVSDSLSGGMQAFPYNDTILVKGLTPNYTCQVVSGALPSGWSLEPSTGAITGTTCESGDFTFMVRVTHNVYTTYVDSAEFTVHVAPVAEARPGDANIDSHINVGDIVFLIDFIFKDGEAPCFQNWCDVNADCALDVGDAVYLINHIFKNGPEPQLGCVE
jgi:aminopeptidase N